MAAKIYGFTISRVCKIHVSILTVLTTGTCNQNLKICNNIM